MSLITSGTHDLAYGSLTLLQLSMHLFTRIQCKDKIKANYY